MHTHTCTHTPTHPRTHTHAHTHTHTHTRTHTHTQNTKHKTHTNTQSHAHMQLSVIIPTYNERENIALALWLLHEHLLPYFSSTESGIKSTRSSSGKHRSSGGDPRWEVIVVDDGSPDGTADVVQHLQRSGHKVGHCVKLVRRAAKLGLGTAYLAGLEQVRCKCGGLIN